MDKTYKWERLTASGKVSPSPVSITTVIVTAHKTKVGIATFYDGESASDPVIMAIHTGSSESNSINFQPPLYTLRGLYADFTADLDEVLICYKGERE